MTTVDDATRCLLCEKRMKKGRERCITDCSHEFCLKCLCSELAPRRNHCPACQQLVKTVHQLLIHDPKQPHATPSPAHIKFSNATYVLNVSIWSVEDPARVLADLFQLEHARLIHQGKLLKKGDVWPGSMVFLFGTRKTTHSTAASTSFSSVVSTTTSSVSHMWRNMAPWLHRLKTIVCCPCTVIYDFVTSLFWPSRAPQRGYVPIPNPPATAAAPERFHAPGEVPSPHYTDSI